MRSSGFRTRSRKRPQGPRNGSFRRSFAKQKAILADFEERYHLPTIEVQRCYKTISVGEFQTNQAKRELVEANLAARRFDREKIYEPRSAIP